MKKLTMCLLLAVSVFVSCSDDDSDTNNNNDGWSNNAAAGKLYGEDFTMKGGRAAFISFANVESVQIDLSPELLGCSAQSGEENFPIRIIAPREEGTFTTDVYVSYSDPNSTDYVNVSNGNTIEITEVTPNFVKGRIRSTSASTDNSLNGTFDVSVCPE